MNRDPLRAEVLSRLRAEDNRRLMAAYRDGWRWVAIGIGSLLDLSGRSTTRAMRRLLERRVRPWWEETPQGRLTASIIAAVAAGLIYTGLVALVVLAVAAQR